MDRFAAVIGKIMELVYLEAISKYIKDKKHLGAVNMDFLTENNS